MENLEFIISASLIVGLSIMFGFWVFIWIGKRHETTIEQHEYYRIKDYEKAFKMHQRINYKGKIEQLKNRYNGNSD